MKQATSLVSTSVMILFLGIINPLQARAEENESKRQEFHEDYLDHYTKGWFTQASGEDGNLTLAELEAAGKVGPEEGLDTVRFKRADKNNDGIVTIQEAKAEKALEIARHGDIEKYFKNHPRLSKDILKYPEAAEYLAQHPKLADLAKEHPDLAERLADHPQAAKYLAERKDLAKFLHNHPNTAKKLANNPNAAEYLAKHENVTDFLKEHPGLHDDLVKSDRARQMLENNPRAVPYLAKHKVAREKAQQARSEWKDLSNKERLATKKHINRKMGPEGKEKWANATQKQRKNFAEKNYSKAKQKAIKAKKNRG
ncbi:MAG: hypothetical protein COV74_04115 [Candidatus Omnitrophica bacterium CG11_big_fil_rev_8_21_14_0_20_45_26]|uniref:EF-hand domain-containing protein n=1 Tax=Candidatus Abzuiibacterium crystallinum TaxID=1974748 RepID=A0A2H0LQ63_9BACT|nr:MAG: hypothetical protein COV74_04115 [Candidatus Omnitrophica bacterium CG11_big_fil_rev_8_21_14_0_20_45_26]PIW64002.1 MAG: hypothetical protein COW12_08865 [Candidatus Omnitrophica bacterium CG12_big_fil_rev_8_21_14_0_65_45_16]